MTPHNSPSVKQKVTTNYGEIIGNRYGDIIISADNFEDLPPAHGEPPYKGLAYFTESDKERYFGREKLSTQLVELLHKSRFLALVGASGSGKSSLLRAGIIPHLRTRNWVIHVISPGAHPVSAIAASLTRDELDPASTDSMAASLVKTSDTLAKVGNKLAARKDAKRLLLAVDQFEELFTQCKDPAEQQAFVDNLVYAVEAEGATTILVSMRADFYDRVSEFTILTDLISQQQVYIKPMAQDELVRVIAEPARLGGWQLVEGLAEQIIEDVGREPGRLPLLSHALLETWERRRGVVMTLGGYRDAGSVEGAIAQTAEETLNRLVEKNPSHEYVTREIFLSLTELSEGTEDTRRTASREELANIDDDTLNAVLEELVAARLITMDKGEVKVSHEALIRRWPTLREWLEDNRERLRFERLLRRDAQLWEELEYDDGTLYRGARLAKANEFIDRRESKLNELTVSFLAASRELAAREKQELEQRLQNELKQTRELARKTEQARREAIRVNRRNLALLVIVSAIAIALLAYTLVIPFIMRQLAADNELVSVPINNGIFVEFERYEVTNERYAKCVDWGPCNRPNGFQTLRATADSWQEAQQLPVAGLDASDAMTFCQWLGRTLPTAEEWDAAVLPVHEWGLMNEDQAVFCRETSCRLEPVGYRTVGQNPSGLPLFDLVGNVGEWTRTKINDDNRCQDIAELPREPELVIVLGDSYLISPDLAGNYQRASDGQRFSDARRPDVGFRCVSLGQRPLEKEYDCPLLTD